MTIKNMTLIIMVSAIISIFSYLLLSTFLLVVFTTLLKKRDIYLASFLSALIIFMFWQFQPYYLINLIFMPLIVLLTHGFIKVTNPNFDKPFNISLGIFSLIIFLVTNFLNSIFYGILYGDMVSVLITNMLSNILIALGNAILVLLLTNTIYKRTQVLFS